ncbi:discoidin domain-containing protein [Pseudoalteromonas sp. T1lg88]|uniref:discoidin domain-containing protein n=1 Tax=Pseudoalteromonas sp. T1lg88 TaxID=2077104 RepID=UPI000CF75046|nr:discoidin domain-containing protein [Pseudoalteromonas sp. T1lg88]
MKKSNFIKVTSVPLVLCTVLSGCGGSDDPNPQDVPVTAASTAAELAGSVVKGTLSGAQISVASLNGTELGIDAEAMTDTQGEVFFTVTGAPGFGINTTVKVTASTTAQSSMVCDALMCGDAQIAQELSGETLVGAQLSTLAQVSVPYGNQADGEADASMQVNALTTLATFLVEQEIANGRNVSSAELMALAQADMSALLLRIMGWQTNNTNVFETPVVSAHSLANFQGAEQCETNEAGEQQCQTPLIDEASIKLSLLNAAFAELNIGETLAANLSAAQADISAALADDAEALERFRQRLFDAIERHPLSAELGFSGASIVDLTLPLFDEASSTGPLKEVSTVQTMLDATISARNAISDAESADKAFDKDVQTKWLDHNDWQGAPSVEDPSWVQVDFATPQAISSVFITSANDAPARDPENFDILASNDGGQSWLTLATVVGATFDERFERQEFAFANAQAYASYRINITKNQGNDGLLQLAEIDFVGPVHMSVDHSDDPQAIASARNSIGDAENQDKAFDNDPTTKWLDHNDWQGAPSNADPSWIQLDLSAPKAVNELAITSANDAPERDPENFSLLASNDGGESWITLASWVGEAFDERTERRTFAVANQLAYSSYRLEISKNKNNDGLLQLAEVELIGPELEGLDHSVSDGATYSARFSISDSESAAQAFDRDVSTKWLDHNDWQGAPTEENPAWIQVQLAEAQAVNELMITSANDAPERDPASFSLLASNDGETWLSLASWAGEEFSERLEQRNFALSNGLAYSHYRLSVSANANNDGLVQIAEVGFIGPQYQLQDLTELPGTLYSARSSIGDGENQDKAFDNDPSTKWLDHNDWQGAPTAENPSWIQADFSVPQVISEIAITSANDAPERDPENFSLLGSNDGGETWVEVASWVGESWDDRLQRRAFSFSNGFAYSSYRVSISKNANNDGLVQIAEIELIGLAN